jgi:hypothetical protein
VGTKEKVQSCKAKAECVRFFQDVSKGQKVLMWTIATILLAVFSFWFCYWAIKEGEAVKKDYEQK